ncbi:MAG: hypothetical protein ACLGHM_09750, partial [Actinomycetes bacterium]
MRALTVRQPWAWAIIHGGKDIENRTRNIAGAYRGPIAIHVAKNADLVALTSLDFVGRIVATKLFRPEAEWFSNSPASAIIGVVDLVDVHHGATYSDESCYRAPAPGEPCVMPVPRCSPWSMRDHHHLVLANPRALANPIPARGR